jgi:hypothetical protein
MDRFIIISFVSLSLISLHLLLYPFRTFIFFLPLPTPSQLEMRAQMVYVPTYRAGFQQELEFLDKFLLNSRDQISRKSEPEVLGSYMLTDRDGDTAKIAAAFVRHNVNLHPLLFNLSFTLVQFS